MIDPEYRLDKDKAMAGLRTLVGEYHRVIEQAEHLAARLRITHLKIGACLEAATGDPIALLRPATSNSRSASSTPAGGSSSKRSAPSRPT